MVERRWAWLRSFRARILFLVLAVGVAPLALLGFWLTGSAARSGEALLRERLTGALEQTVSQVGGRWIRVRSWMLDVAASPALQTGLASASAISPTLGVELPLGVRRIVVTRHDGRPAGEVRSEGASDGEEVATVRLPIYARTADTIIGALTAELAANHLIAPGANVASLTGVVLAAFDPETRRPLLPLPFDPALVAANRFVWGGEPWIAVRRGITEPPVLLVATAPVAPFVAPFQAAARRGTALLVLVAGSGLLLALLATGRLTRSLEQLAAAAGAVAAGDLERKVEARDPDEVGRVAQAFNTMTVSLRRTLHELARREAQAAAGEFASSLAHEVRNPLTAIRVDLQVVEEHLPADSPLRDVQARALAEIVRLDRTVGEALAQASHGGLGTRELDLREPLRAALHAATPTFTERRVPVPEIDGPDTVVVRGEPGALEQLFLNLLLNAAQAVNPGGAVRVTVEARQDATLVTIADSGHGIPDEVRERIFQPFFSTRAEGTGLGLPIARRIAEAHGGQLSIASQIGEGTTVEVRLPLGR